MIGSLATPAGSMETVAEAVFPSLSWFQELARLARVHRSRFEHLGYADCVAEFCVTDGRPSPFAVQVTFEEFDVTDVRIPSVSDHYRADFRVEGDLATWQRMLESIARNHGRPDLDQTLNHLTHMGTPMRVTSTDPLRRDLYFRYAQTLQEFFNLSAAIHTHFAANVGTR
ncbi:MAG: hypothetical protein N3C12_06415 [Candidatus Binatia bacterium]|nr:hypothetical protein [Candidatus Binatia bacterium]